MEIYGMQKDMEAFGRLLPERQERIAKASAEPVRDDPDQRPGPEAPPGADRSGHRGDPGGDGHDPDLPPAGRRRARSSPSSAPAST